MSRRKKKKKHRSQVVAFPSQPYNQSESGESPSPYGPEATKSGLGQAQTAGRGGSSAVRGPGQEPHLPRQVPVYGPGDSGLLNFTLSESCARDLRDQGKVRIVRVTQHTFGVQIVPPPKPEPRKVVAIRGKDACNPHHRDTPDNPEGCWTFGQGGVPGPRLPNGKPGPKDPATFRDKNFRALPRWADLLLFRGVILSVLPPSQRAKILAMGPKRAANKKKAGNKPSPDLFPPCTKAA